MTPRNATIKSYYDPARGGWCGVDYRVGYACDSTLRIEVGDRLVAHSKISGSEHRGYLYLRERDIVERVEAETPPLSSRLHNYAKRRLAKLHLSPKGKSTVEAMVIGERRGLDREEVQRYRRSGCSHILAISGLHLMVVAGLFMLLFAPLGLLWRGYIARRILCLGAIWLFASMNFFSASLVRASIMFSLLLLLPLISRGYHGLSALLLTGGTMLLFDWALIYDVGFQLSFICVGAILGWAIPLWRQRPTLLRNVVSNVTLLPILIGLCCSVATLPLVAYHFGAVSLWGVLVNPIIILTAQAIVSLSVVWLLVGLAPLATLFRPLLELLVEIQSGVVGWVASLSGGVSMIEMEIVEAILIYLLYGIATVILHRALPRWDKNH